MFKSEDNAKLSELIEREIFISFFNFKFYGADGEAVLDGLCKIAKSADPEIANYMAATIIFDTPDELRREIAKRITVKLNLEAFKRANPETYAITSLPASLMAPPDHYVHHIDIIFAKGFEVNPRDAVNAIVYTLRHVGGLDTEQPQWWEDGAPKQCEAEKANWTERIKAFLRME